MPFHVPVLVAEVLETLAPRPGGIYVDATVGGGGHAAAILEASAPDGRVIGFDWDDEALAAARVRLSSFGARVELVPNNFADLEQTMMALGMTAVDGVLFDLGVSSHQLREAARGFSWQQDGPLDMRMCRTLGVTARDILRTASLEELVQIFRRYGEEPRARAIARAVVAARERGEPLETTMDLARLCGPRRGRIHPATRVFQALRIAVNRELENLQRGLAGAWRLLKPGGRLVVISFHSLEDRIVKQFLKERAGAGEARLLTRKPRMATRAEVQANPRARSAKLRAAEKL
ncbi:MAG: 16S rRNA (cytosine(1402)-N(4))-methyltransferase RsmH [Verrucomicrobiae bacterium]|nr:16S rRNA (cytosine(1402)-N(4))-methyltransferase RsmH [Verrucomicrobiae bacterium]